MSTTPPVDPEHRADKLSLFILAALVVIVLGMMVGGVFFTKTVPDKGDVLLGGIATGLILFLQRLVDAVRSSWESVTQSKTMDALGKSAPVELVDPNTPAGTPEDPLHVAGAEPSLDAPAVITEEKGKGKAKP